MPGRMESEIFFDALALNEAGGGAAAGAARGDAAAGLASTARQGGEELLARFSFELAGAFAARRDLLAEQGRLLPGAAEAVTGLAAWPGVVQTVLTGGIKPNAVEKLRAFGLEQFFDLEVGGYGSQVYTKGAQLMMTRSRAADKYGTRFDEGSTVYIADSTRDVAAARTGGARCLAVASGRSTVSELRKAGADVVFDDLCDTAAIVAAVDRLTLAAAG